MPRTLRDFCRLPDALGVVAAIAVSLLASPQARAADLLVNFLLNSNTGARYQICFGTVTVSNADGTDPKVMGRGCAPSLSENLQTLQSNVLLRFAAPVSIICPNGSTMMLSSQTGAVMSLNFSQNAPGTSSSAINGGNPCDGSSIRLTATGSLPATTYGVDFTMYESRSPPGGPTP